MNLLTIEFGRKPEQTTGGLLYNSGYAWGLAAKMKYERGILAKLVARLGYGPHDSGVRDAIEGKPQAWKG